jgi:cyclophilin family peptidyl-prolyl cis-trans isomerase
MSEIKGLWVIILLSVIVIVGGIIIGVNKKKTQAPMNTQETTTTQDTVAQVSKAVIATNYGTFTIELYGDKTPKTVENFTNLAKNGFYTNTKFHRVIKGFMIQGGDPLSKDDSQKDYWGTGGPGYQFEDEIVSGLSNVTGTLSMANAGAGTNRSQFFINVADNTFLDGKHTVFGKVLEGMDVIFSIAATQTDGNDRPVKPVEITSIEIL